MVGMLVFGLAPSTRTHPYYLSQLAAPCAAVLAIGLNEAGHRFRHRARLSWALPVLIAIAGAYQLYLFRTTVSSWVQAGVIIGLGATVGILILAFPRRVTHTPLAKGAAIAGCLVLLAIPLAIGTAQSAASAGGNKRLCPATGRLPEANHPLLHHPGRAKGNWWRLLPVLLRLGGMSAASSLWELCGPRKQHPSSSGGFRRLPSAVFLGTTPFLRRNHWKPWPGRVSYATF